METYDIWIWVAVVVVSLIIEFISMDITSIWFSIGGVVALILASFTSMLEVQIVVFIVISAGLLLTLRRWAKNKLLNSSNEATNLDLLKQEKLKLLTPITNTEKGSVKYNGVVWSAMSENNEPIEADTFVQVVQVKGNKLIVKKEN
jgi:membrane protein implicated in regulation of membrane protease activity